MEKNTHSAVSPHNPSNYREINWSSLEQTPSRGLNDNIDTFPRVEALEADLKEQEKWQVFVDDTASKNNSQKV